MRPPHRIVSTLSPPVRRTPIRSARLLLAALLLAPLLASGTAAAAPVPSPAPTLATTAELERRLAQRQAEAEAGQAHLETAQEAATRGLQEAQQAQRAAEQAARTYAEAVARHRYAQVQTAGATRDLDRLASSLYRRGGRTGQSAWYVGIVTEGRPDALLGNLDLAQRVGDHDAHALEDLEEAEAAEARAAEAAQQAVEEQRAANVRAAATRKAADAVVAKARAQVAARQAALRRTVAEVADARRRDALLARAEAIARVRSAVPVEAIAGALAPRPSATCDGGVLRGYPNGMLPEQALCALWGTSGQMLRADAAAAFNDMSRAYALAFGAPICVTDSYRSYPEQVAVREAKPTLAAVPGTSNHGWAVAVDLCDGVQTFGTPQHAWLVANSLRFGWFLPAWAQQGGSKPEAWHWEFAG